MTDTHRLTPREKVALKPCPFCGGRAEMSRYSGNPVLWCETDGCFAMMGGEEYYGTEDELVSSWNRRTALASGSGDHAELAKLAEAATPGPWHSAGGYLTVRDPDGRSFSSTIYHLDEMGQRRPTQPFQAVPFARAADAAFIAAANPATVLALIAEIAALRAERDHFESEFKRQCGATADVIDRATEAERKLAEAVGVVEWYGENARLARLIHSEGDAGRNALADDGGKRARTFLSKEAERG